MLPLVLVLPPVPSGLLLLGSAATASLAKGSGLRGAATSHCNDNCTAGAPRGGCAVAGAPAALSGSSRGRGGALGCSPTSDSFTWRARTPWRGGDERAPMRWPPNNKDSTAPPLRLRLPHAHCSAARRCAAPSDPGPRPWRNRALWGHPVTSSRVPTAA